MFLGLSKEAWVKVGKGALIAVSGALLTYAGNILVQLDFNGYTPLITALGAVLINILRKAIGEFLSGKPIDPEKFLE